jgi:hypothetical protein
MRHAVPVRKFDACENYKRQFWRKWRETGKATERKFAL